jgi:hypothetical protein
MFVSYVHIKYVGCFPEWILAVVNITTVIFYGHSKLKFHLTDIDEAFENNYGIS